MLFNLGLFILIAFAIHFEKKSINIFGFWPVPQRFYQLISGFVLTALLALFINIFFSLAAHFSWVRNDNFGLSEILKGSYSTLNSVIYEELIFRTYLLYKLLQWFGERNAVFITSIAFGIYHWFTFEILGNYPMMAWVFFQTGLWGLMFAYCYTRTGTILLGLGLHWGWNYFDQLIFNKDGNGFLKPIVSTQTIFLNNVAGFAITILPTILFALLVIFYLLKTKTVVVTEGHDSDYQQHRLPAK